MPEISDESIARIAGIIGGLHLRTILLEDQVRRLQQPAKNGKKHGPKSKLAESEESKDSNVSTPP